MRTTKIPSQAAATDLTTNIKYYAIIGDNSEEFDDNNNPVLNPTNVIRGANHLAEGDTANSLANRAKIRLSAEEWNTIKPAIEHGQAIPADASKKVLLGYHYALQRQSRQLAKERIEIRKRKDLAIAASAALVKHAAMHHIRTAKGTIGTVRKSKTLITRIEETSLGTLTHLSYQSMNKATLCQKHHK
jgi:hypothetical protein